jgi:hypothetical protein
MIKKCITLNGKIINIGDWDYKKQKHIVSPAETDDNGNIIKETVYKDEVTNPMPDGAIEEDVDIAESADGGLCSADDYANLRKAAYPTQNPWDVLDEVLKVISIPEGSRLATIQAERTAVKGRYPKP